MADNTEDRKSTKELRQSIAEITEHKEHLHLGSSPGGPFSYESGSVRTAHFSQSEYPRTR